MPGIASAVPGIASPMLGISSPMLGISFSCIKPLNGSIKLAREMGDGEMGRWGDDEARGYFYTFFPILFLEILTPDS